MFKSILTSLSKMTKKIIRLDLNGISLECQIKHNNKKLNNKKFLKVKLIRHQKPLTLMRYQLLEKMNPLNLSHKSRKQN
jgi:hypothetical protein